MRLRIFLLASMASLASLNAQNHQFITDEDVFAELARRSPSGVLGSGLSFSPPRGVRSKTSLHSEALSSTFCVEAYTAYSGKSSARIYVESVWEENTRAIALTAAYSWVNLPQILREIVSNFGMDTQVVDGKFYVKSLSSWESIILGQSTNTLNIHAFSEIFETLLNRVACIALDTSPPLHRGGLPFSSGPKFEHALSGDGVRRIHPSSWYFAGSCATYLRTRQSNAYTERSSQETDINRLQYFDELFSNLDYRVFVFDGRPESTNQAYTQH